MRSVAAQVKVDVNTLVKNNQEFYGNDLNVNSMIKEGTVLKLPLKKQFDLSKLYEVVKSSDANVHIERR